MRLFRPAVFTVIIFLTVLFLSVSPLQAGRNLFRPDTDQSQQDEKTFNLSKKGTPEQVKKLEVITQSVQQGSAGLYSPYSYVIVVFLLALLIVFAYVLRKFLQERYLHSLEDPLSLFRELCTAHQLTWTEQQLLQDIAEEQKLSDPLPIFIEPQYMQSALNDEQFEKSRSSIETLLEKLFDSTEPEMPGISSNSKTGTVDTTIAYPQRSAVLY
jgi:hypothetical protein